MAKSIQIDKFGGPEVMQWRNVDLPAPKTGEALIRHTAVGLNFIDTYHRSGLYPLDLPTGLGTEAAGVVEAVGDGVTDVVPGDRVAYLGLPPGSYCDQRIYPADRLVRLPAEIDDQTAAAAMLKGLTAWYLVRRSYPIESGDNVLLYAAAGGVGLIAGQWASSLGATVIGVVSSDEKAELARANGSTHIVKADDPDFVETVRKITGGEGVAGVYDSVGKDTFYQSLDCLRPHGTMVSFGNASGAVDPFSIMELAKRGSLTLTRPAVFDFIKTRPELLAAAGELFEVMLSGAVKIHVNQTYALKDAAEAHRDLEARKTTGSTVLLP
jgi:NADPH2:quinone reductase